MIFDFKFRNIFSDDDIIITVCNLECIENEDFYNVDINSNYDFERIRKWFLQHQLNFVSMIFDFLWQEKHILTSKIILKKIQKQMKKYFLNDDTDARLKKLTI